MTYDIVFVNLYDILAAQILLVAGSVLLMVLVAWLNPKEALGELENGVGQLGTLGDAWIWLVRVPVLVVLMVTLYLGVTDYVGFLRTDFAEFLFG